MHALDARAVSRSRRYGFAMTRTIGLIVGSLRKESFTRKVANAIARVGAAGLTFKPIDISNVSMFNQDLEMTPSKDWVALKSAISAVDGVLFATPEYNRSIPGVLKNAIDVASRPYGQSAWAGKPAAIVSVSPGAIGGFGANHHLRQVLAYLDMPTLPQPEMYIGNAAKLLDDQGEVPEDTRELFRKFTTAFAGWVEHIAHEHEMRKSA
jgi:chromate reductase